MARGSGNSGKLIIAIPTVIGRFRLDHALKGVASLPGAFVTTNSIGV
jgi:hypothetical protein